MKRVSDTAYREMLLRLEKPGRYTGGEYGSVHREGGLTVAVSYPDLYEIGMSNNAVRILYGRLNRIDGVQCERVFAPAADCERELRARGIPLFSLESRRPLCEFDVMAFSVGYELNATAVLQILDCGGVPLSAKDRLPTHPVVLGGGPGLTNPAPFLRFFDGVFIGEAEGWIEEAFARLCAMKRAGAGRANLLSYLETFPAIVSRRKPSAVRAVWRGFSQEEPDDGFPVASLKAAQDHGTVEIMRGCPNGCRFCNAGFFYRPFRLRPAWMIARQAARLVFDYGYREVSLSSLSTGDYPGIGELVRRLNRDFAHLGTSFSLPSLKIDSLALELFREINTVRKSGLTFAVETPCEETQRRVNKTVPLDKTINLLLEAKALGWRQAKFYFMLGLPGFTEKDETELILECLFSIQRATRLSLHVNVGTFVPKPHTPFQWCAQLSEEEARRRIGVLRARLPKHSFKVSFHLPFQSVLEGVITRGDERVGGLIERAYREGARLCAWEEHFNVDIWRRVLTEAGWDAAGEATRERPAGEQLPWSGIDLGVKEAVLKREAVRARRGELTSPCRAECALPCGVCGPGLKAGKALEDRAGEGEVYHRLIDTSREIIARNERHPVLFTFSKTGTAAFLSHLNVMTVFERALLRAGYFCRMTEGFNPKPVMEFANPLPLGFESRFEVAAVELYHFDEQAEFIQRINRSLPEGFLVFKAKPLPVWQPGQKKRSLMSLCCGGDYIVKLTKDIIMNEISDDPELRYFRHNAVKKELIIRYAGTVAQAHSLKKVLTRLVGSDDFLRACQPMRVMTLALNEQGIFTNLYQVL